MHWLIKNQSKHNQNTNAIGKCTLCVCSLKFTTSSQKGWPECLSLCRRVLWALFDGNYAAGCGRRLHADSRDRRWAWTMCWRTHPVFGLFSSLLSLFWGEVYFGSFFFTFCGGFFFRGKSTIIFPHFFEFRSSLEFGRICHACSRCSEGIALTLICSACGAVMSDDALPLFRVLPLFQLLGR
jgi:hypothetical protein